MEHVIHFQSNWIDKWIAPNPFIGVLLPPLADSNVSLSDFAFARDPKNVGETALVVSVNKMRLTVVVGLDQILFRLINPDWTMAEDLVVLLDSILDALQKFVAIPIKSQDSTMVFHVTGGPQVLASRTARLINQDQLGNADFYGVSCKRKGTSFLLEQSLKYPNGAFFRLERTFDAPSRFADVALSLYEDEQNALELLGLGGILP